MIELRNLSKDFHVAGEPLPVLRDVNLVVREGEIIAIVGPSGCGKTTLLRIIAGLEVPTEGEVAVRGMPAGAEFRRSLCSLVFQEAALLNWLTARQNIDLLISFASRGVENRRGMHENGQVGSLLDRVGLSAFSNAYPDQLSVGMKTRVALVRALALDRRILLMDEPFAALDEVTRIRMYSVLAGCLERSGATLIFVTHLVEEAAVLADRIVVLGGRPAVVRGVVTSNTHLATRLVNAADHGFASTAREIRHLLGVDSYS